MSFSANIDEVVAENRNGLLGVHPSWKRVRVKEIAKIFNGFPFESSRFSKTNGIPLIRIRDILSGQTETFYKGKVDPAFLVRRGEILVGMDGDFHCSPWGGDPALLNQRVCKIIPDESLYSKEFLRYALPGYLSAINTQTSSVTVKHLSSRTVSDIPLPFPALHEQRRIVAEIEKQFTRLDAGVSALKRIQANLKRYRTAVLNSACKGKLVKEGARWVKTTGGELCEYITSGSRDWKSYYSTQGALFIRTQDINQDRLELSNIARVNLPVKVEGKRSLIQAGDILVTITGANVGKVALVPEGLEEAYVSQSVGLMRLKDKRWAPFLHYYLQSDDVGRKHVLGMVYGIGRPVLSLKNLRDIEIHLPSYEEQLKIVSEIERRLSVVDELEAAVRLNLDRAMRLRQAVLQRAFLGKL